MKCLLFVIFILSFAGCSPDKKEASAVPTTADAIDKAQSSAFGIKSPLSIQTGEFVYTLRTQQIFSSQEPAESLLEEQSITVVDRQDVGQYIEFTIVKEQIDHMLPESPHYKFKDVLYLEKAAVTPLSVAKAISLTEEEPVAPPVLEDPNPVIVEFFNLKVLEEAVRKPKAVLDREPCNDVDIPCTINMFKITYDIRVTVPPQLPQTTSIETWISQEVPYLAAVYKSCFKTVLIIDDARPVVRQCTSVVDYKFQ
ncbi:MAG: hypothetical protein IT287_06015 [Bdellovibrionaceae bacterium]|nr:hypothetical protein [Pseudobdellovibrionaceae bacterium]